MSEKEFAGLPYSEQGFAGKPDAPRAGDDSGAAVEDARRILAELVAPSGKGEQHCLWCSRMSYVGDDDPVKHYGSCPSFAVMRLIKTYDTLAAEDTRKLLLLTVAEHEAKTLAADLARVREESQRRADLIQQFQDELKASKAARQGAV